MRRRMFNFLVQVGQLRVLLILFLEIILGIVLSIGSLLFFSKLIRDVFQNDFLKLDLNLSLFIYQFRNPVLTKIMEFVSFLGSGEFLLMVSLLIILAIFRKYRLETRFFIIVILMGFVINNVLKIVIQRPRPEIAPLLFPQTYSFPSGHAMNAFVFYAFIAFYVYRFTRDKKISFLVFLMSVVLIILIGLSRVYLGVHYPTDVIGGFIAGFWWFVTVVVIEKTIIFFRLYKKSLCA